MRPYKLFLFSLGLVSACAISGAANASTLVFGAILSGANEVPPNSSIASGSITATLNDVAGTLVVDETFTGLTGGFASAAHIHCCATPGTNANVVLPFTGFPNATSGSYVHTFTLATDLVGITVATFIAGLESGLAYANIHDAVFPGGEIRGQLSQVPLPGALPLFATGLGALGLLGWRRKKKLAA